MTVTVYSKDNCPGCENTKYMLRLGGVEFEEKNINHDPQAMEWLLAQGHRSVPVIYNGGMHVEDYVTLF